jgi:parallel beta-helix repeat protein
VLESTVTLSYAQEHQYEPDLPITNEACILAFSNHHSIIRNNDLHDCTEAGVESGWSDYVTVENNVVHDNAWYSSWAGSGISLWDQRDVDDETGYKNIVSSNVVYNNKNFIPFLEYSYSQITDGEGIVIDDNKNTETNNVPYEGRTLIANNVAYGNGSEGIAVYESQHVDVVNNTMFHNSAEPGLRDQELGVNVSDDVVVVNNVMAPLSNNWAGRANGTSITWDFNVQAENVAVQGPNDILADPTFVDATCNDFRLARGSAGIDNGTSLLAPATDVLQAPRPQGDGFDCGAYEQ